MYINQININQIMYLIYIYLVYVLRYCATKLMFHFVQSHEKSLLWRNISKHTPAKNKSNIYSFRTK